MLLPWWFNWDVAKKYFWPEPEPVDERCTEYCAYCDDSVESFALSSESWVEVDGMFSKDQLDFALRLWDGELSNTAWCRHENRRDKKVALTKRLAPA